jgi:NlpC/P60 family putative phage cell wall peptidase
VSGRAEIVDAARRWIGTPYRHQASLPGVGCDCLGLLRGIWREVIGAEPETVGAYQPGWAEDTPRGNEPLLIAAARHLAAIDPAMMEPGDVLAFRWRAHLPAKHLAVLSAPRRMIHAHDGALVCEVDLSPWWQRHLAAVFRFPEHPTT